MKESATFFRLVMNCGHDYLIFKASLDAGIADRFGTKVAAAMWPVERKIELFYRGQFSGSTGVQRRAAGPKIFFKIMADQRVVNRQNVT